MVVYGASGRVCFLFGARGCLIGLGPRLAFLTYVHCGVLWCAVLCCAVHSFAVLRCCALCCAVPKALLPKGKRPDMSTHG